MNQMNTAADHVCDLMMLLSNKSRLMILCLLTEGEKSVGELADAIGIRDTAVSQHLAVLRRERIVKARRDGQTMFYRILRQDVRDLLDHLYETYCGAAAKPEESKT